MNMSTDTSSRAEETGSSRETVPETDPGSAVDPDSPNVARIYDYFLGGQVNYPADRAAADRIAAEMPQTPLTARAMRRWLTRTVRSMVVDEGITQFLDLGAGLPTQENVHQVAARHTPEAKVVYVDTDPVVLAHGRQLLDGTASVLILGDVMEMAAVLEHPRVVELLDFARPLGVLISGVLHFLPDAVDPHSQIALLRDRLAPGSCLAVNSLVSDHDRDRAERLMMLYRGETGKGELRSAAEVARFFGDFIVQPPGLVPLDDWRPDAPVPPADDPGRLVWGGMASNR
jgi:hypothetical protein